MKTAILLAAYNGQEWIEEQIKTILAQYSVELDLYISVDLCDDNTYAIVRKIESEFPNVYVLEYGERYGGAAKNFYRLIRDVDFSGYANIALSDQDDIWEINKLDLGIKAMDFHCVNAYSSNVTAFWPNGKCKLIKKSYAQKKYDFLFESAGPGCTYIFKSKSFKLFKEFLCFNWDGVNDVDLHDWMIYAFYRSRELGWHIDERSTMQYRQHSSNQFGSNNGIVAFKKRLDLIRKKWYKNQVEKISKLVGVTIPKNWLFIRNVMQFRRKKLDAIFLLLLLVFGVY